MGFNLFAQRIALCCANTRVRLAKKMETIYFANFLYLATDVKRPRLMMVLIKRGLTGATGAPNGPG
jgi:hypothetical protein